MKNRFRSLLSLALAVILMASLLPVSAAAASTPDLGAVYSAYTDFINDRLDDVGKPIWDESFYNLVNTNKRDAKLKKIEGASLIDVTGDGVKELIIKYRVEYKFESYMSFGSTQAWTLIYQYRDGQLVKIGESPYHMKKVGDNSWTVEYQDMYFGVGDIYLCYGDDGKVYFCDNLPFVSDKIFKFFGYNGNIITESAKFYANFIPDRFAGIALTTGRYVYEMNDVEVSYNTYTANRDHYYANGYTKFELSTVEAVLSEMETDLAAYEFSKINPFVDVTYYDYFAQPVLWAKDNGITSGYSDTIFGSGDGCTRGQVVTFLWRAAGKPAPTSDENPFTDVASDAFYYEAVLWAVENSITTGMGEGLFAPNATCNRGQIVTFLHRAMDKPASSGSNPFSDVSSADFFYQPVLWAVANNITSGTTKTTFSPNDTCTRAQVVTFLYRAYKDYVKPTPAPSPSPSPAPVVTPKPVDKDVCDGGLAALKEEVLNSGEYDIEGYPIISMTREYEGRTLVSIISYMEEENQFLFTDRTIYNGQFTDISMLLDADNIENAAISFDCEVTEISAVTLITTSSYSLNNDIFFSYTTDILYSERDVQTLCNLSLDTAMLGWEKLLQEHFGTTLTLGDLGFTAWEKSLNANWVEGAHNFYDGICTRCGTNEPD